MGIDALATHATIGSVAQAARGLAQSLVAAARERLNRRRSVSELAGLEGRDLDRVLADIGCDRDEVMTLMRCSASARPLVDRMIERLGLAAAVAAAGPGLMRELEHRCGMCRVQRRCGKWMRANADPDAYREFCPNTPNFDAIAPR